MKIDAEKLAELSAKYGKVFLLENEVVDVSVVCKAPNRMAYKRFKSELTDDNKRGQALEKMFMECIVFPSREDFDKILEEYPALPDSFGAALGVQIGMGDASIKKV